MSPADSKMIIQL